MTSKVIEGHIGSFMSKNPFLLDITFVYNPIV